MSSRDRLKRASRRQIDRLGVPITVTDTEQVETTTHGTRHEQTDPYEIPAIPDPDGESQYMFDFGRDVDYDMVFLCRDDDAASMTDGQSEERGSEIEFRGATFLVATVNMFHDNGVAIVGCNTGGEP